MREPNNTNVRGRIPTSAPAQQPDRVPLWWLIFAGLIVGGGFCALFLL